jgi:hypothetical protein
LDSCGVTDIHEVGVVQAPSCQIAVAHCPAADDEDEDEIAIAPTHHEVHSRHEDKAGALSSPRGSASGLSWRGV